MSKEQVDLKYTIGRVAGRLRGFSELLKFQTKEALYSEEGIYAIGDMLGELADELKEIWDHLDQNVVTDDEV